MPRCSNALLYVRKPRPLLLPSPPAPRTEPMPGPKKPAFSRRRSGSNTGTMKLSLCFTDLWRCHYNCFELLRTPTSTPTPSPHHHAPFSIACTVRLMYISSQSNQFTHTSSSDARTQPSRFAPIPASLQVVVLSWPAHTLGDTLLPPNVFTGAAIHAHVGKAWSELFREKKHRFVTFTARGGCSQLQT
jgi:hypothetical protein